MLGSDCGLAERHRREALNFRDPHEGQGLSRPAPDTATVVLENRGIRLESPPVHR
jgi:hypothetical protein